MSCRSCGHGGLDTILDLGPMPLANALPAHAGATEERFPLLLAFCPACALLQITDTVAPERLFREYLYFSSYSETLLRHARELADRLILARGLGAHSTVIEIASNDGYLLQFYRERGVPVLGIEPAENVARVARDERGIPTLAEFFGPELAARLRGRADVLHVHNVLAHVADLHGVVAGMRDVLAPDGVAVVEVPYARAMIELHAFDTIYHEHLCYFTATSLAPLLTKHGLVARDVERIPVQGGSLRLFLEHDGAPGPSFTSLLEEERALGLGRTDYYRGFAAGAAVLRADLIALVRRLRDGGKRVAAYGASAKGAVLLNYAGLGRESIDFVVDRNPHKQGRFLPGVAIPICAPSALLEERPDALLLLAWNLADEIIARHPDFRGRFIIPIPEVRLV